MVKDKESKKNIENTIDCKTIAQKIKNETKENINKLKEKGLHPKLTVLTNPTDEPAKAYVRNKRKVCEEVGIKFEEIPFDKNTDYAVLEKVALDKNPVVVQLPINKDIDNEETWKFINKYFCIPTRDVDGFCKDALVSPATAKGVMKIFDEITLSNFNLEGQHVCIIGRGKTCAKPLVQMMLDRNATITICHSYTNDLAEITKQCDVIVSCVGKPHLITANHVKPGAVVINVGLSINPKTGKLTGDIDFKNCKSVASCITKNIGGVGLLTTACLVENVVDLYKKNKEKGDSTYGK